MSDGVLLYYCDCAICDVSNITPKACPGRIKERNEPLKYMDMFEAVGSIPVNL